MRDKESFATPFVFNSGIESEDLIFGMRFFKESFDLTADAGCLSESVRFKDESLV
jgi:hypothetical protein